MTTTTSDDRQRSRRPKQEASTASVSFPKLARGSRSGRRSCSSIQFWNWPLDGSQPDTEISRPIGWNRLPYLRSRLLTVGFELVVSYHQFVGWMNSDESTRNQSSLKWWKLIRNYWHNFNQTLNSRLLTKFGSHELVPISMNKWWVIYFEKGVPFFQTANKPEIKTNFSH